MKCFAFFHINNKSNGTNRIIIGYIRRVAEYAVLSKPYKNCCSAIHRKFV